jgi:hypothetical protein
VASDKPVAWSPWGARPSGRPLGPARTVLSLSRWSFERAHRACSVRRTHANRVKLRRNTGATGHDEGRDIVMRVVNSCTRASSLRKRHWIVSMVAEAHGVVRHTARRQVSSKTEAADCHNNLH